MPTRNRRFSYSALDAYQQCPRRYLLKFELRVSEPFVGAELAMGSAVHGALEDLFNDPQRITHAALERSFCQRWSVECAKRQVRVVKEGMTLNDYRDLGCQLVRTAYDIGVHLDGLSTISVEQSFCVPLGQAYQLVGRFDRVARDANGDLHVIDYKTGAVPAEVTPGLDLQRRCYGLAAIRNWVPPRVFVTHRFLRGGKAASLGLCHEASDVPAQEAALIAVVQEITTATKFPARRSALCEWCAYYGTCESVPDASPLGDCPKCGAVLVRKNSRFGPFLSCSDFPACRFSKDLSPA